MEFRRPLLPAEAKVLTYVIYKTQAPNDSKNALASINQLPL